MIEIDRPIPLLDIGRAFLRNKDIAGAAMFYMCFKVSG